MKYIIYGTNRVAKDFLYIFDNLEILYFTESRPSHAHFLGYPVHDLNYALQDTAYDQIILCDFDKTEKRAVLEQQNLSYGKDFIYEEDFFPLLDEIRIPGDRRIAVWGTGLVAKKLTDYNETWKTDCYIDTYKSEEQFCGIRVVTPDKIEEWKDYFVIIAVAKDQEILDYLRAQGLREKIDFANYQMILGTPSALLRRTIFDRAYYDLECRTMLNHLEVFYRGNTRCCCTTFVEQNLDNVLDKDVDALWHSNLHKVLCLSTENRTYTFCDKSMCPLFVAKKNGQGKVTDRPYRSMSDRPEVLAVGYDSSCNLSCVSCRKELRIATGQELENLSRITRKLKEEYLPACRFLILAGDGEVFASRTYQELYEDENSNAEFIRLLSNGTLFTPERWERFAQGKTGKIMLTVSIDAATKDTYERIRRNGNFEQLQKNMEFAASLRKEGRLRYFRMNFVVQAENYREMVPFVKWGERLGVDEVFFTKILNWGTYTEEEFARISMMEKDGITPKKELKEVLEDPVMRSSSIADLGTIQYSHREDETELVENYYMWELEKRGGKIFV